MKFCEICGEEIFTKDGENRCATCENQPVKPGTRKYGDRLRAKKAREQVLKDCGLVKVRGAMGGTYWE